MHLNIRIKLTKNIELYIFFTGSSIKLILNQQIEGKNRLANWGYSEEGKSRKLESCNKYVKFVDVVGEIIDFYSSKISK